MTKLGKDRVKEKRGCPHKSNMDGWQRCVRLKQLKEVEKSNIKLGNVLLVIYFRVIQLRY